MDVILTFTSQFTIALFAYIPNCHDTKTDKKSLLINTFFFYLIIKCSPSYSSPSLKTPSTELCPNDEIRKYFPINY